MSGSPDTEAADLASAAVGLLGDEVVAVYLHGSAATGDFVDGLSDLDVLIVVDSEVGDPVLDHLVDEAGMIGRGSRLNIDLRLVNRDVARRVDRLPQLEAGISVRPVRTPDAFVEQRREVEVDLLNEFSLCRHRSTALVGPVADTVIGDVPPAWIVEVGVEQLERWQQLPFEPRYADLMTFTACRVWRHAVEGEHSSKVEAARWTLRRRPDLDAAGIACDRRAGDRAAELDEAKVRRLVAAVLDECNP